MVLLTPPPSPRTSRKAMKVEKGLSGRFAPSSLGGFERKIAADPRRWSVLAVYAAASFMAALVWNILAPVYAVAMQRFDYGAC